MLMSGYQKNEASNSSKPEEALVLRTLPLTAPIVSVVPSLSSPWYGGSIHYRDVYFPLLDALVISAADGTAESVYRGDRPIAQECMLS